MKDEEIKEEVKKEEVEKEETLPEKHEQILTNIGILRGEMVNGLLYYHILAKDINNKKFVLAFAIKVVHQESIEKAFRRMFPVKAPWDVEQVGTITSKADAPKVEPNEQELTKQEPTQTEMPFNEQEKPTND
jgi:hypothetical protein